MLALEGVQVWRGDRAILELERLHLDGRQFTAILGHNGSGKSTLMKLLARQLTPDNGAITLEGQPIDRYSQRVLARRLAYLPQQLPAVAGLSVRELVRLGRFPWRGLLGRGQADDAAIVEEALSRTDTLRYADRLAEHLSGGERQRAWIAMLLAQQSPLLLLDEPTSALDLAHQYDAMRLLRDLNRSAGRGVIVILHDVNLAVRYADRVIALKRGRIMFDGAPTEFLAPDLLSELYGIRIDIAAHPTTGDRVAVVAG